MNSLPPVQKQRCATCPFNENGDQLIKANVISRILTEASQLCHHVDNKLLCRGARDYQIEIYHRLGVLAEPTDKAWSEAYERIRSKN